MRAVQESVARSRQATRAGSFGSFPGALFVLAEAALEKKNARLEQEALKRQAAFEWRGLWMQLRGRDFRS